MNIDLLLTAEGEAGLIAAENLMQKVAGVVLDTQSGILSLEFADMDYQDLNIPVDSHYFQYLDINPLIHIGAVKAGNIAQAYQVPLMFSDDPYRNQNMKPKQPDNPLMAFGYFLKHCVAGQPVQREDLGDETSMGCILGDSSPASLKFAPHLARAHQLEAKPTIAPVNAPGMGLGGSSGGGGTVRRNTGGQNGGDDNGR
jgi:hypothetical protein